MMKFKSYIFTAIAATAALCFTSCSDDEPNGGQKVEAGKYSLSGKVEKGPFVRGSSISIQPLNESMTAIGTVFNGEIQDNTGSFNLGQMELASQFVRIAADGYYFNEVEGNLSNGQLHLVALADLSDKSTVNVNILTHLKSARIQKLVASGKTFADANKQAQKELLTQFGLQKFENTSAESLSITSGNDGAGVLIAISSLVLSDRSDASITEHLSYLTEDLADDGTFDEYSMRCISNDRSKLRYNLDYVSSNIISRYEEMGQNVTVPDLRYYFDWNGDGIAGNEINDNPQITLSQTEVNFPKEGGLVEISVSSNVTLSLEPIKDPYGDNGLVNPGEYYNDNFFDNSGKPMNCETSFDGSKLTIKSAKTEYHSTQSQSIYLYNLMGESVAEVKVTLAGDPNIEQKLSGFGQGIVQGCYEFFAKAISYDYYVERGYSGMYQFYDVRCPLTPNDSYNRNAYNALYQSIAYNNNAINALAQVGEESASAFFRLLNAIAYTEIADKWGNSCIMDVSNNEANMNPRQLTKNDILRYAESELDAISSVLTDKKSVGYPSTAEQAFDISKDVWRVAKANVYMQLGNYATAASLLQQIVDGGRYSLSSGNDYEMNSGTILLFDVPQSFVREYPAIAGHKVGFYTYSDVLLTLAECQHHTGNSNAASLVSKVASKKGISISGDTAKDIETVRKALFTPRYFAFQKRNNLGGYADYQKLWPIPASQLVMVNGWQQNPGY